MRGLAQRCPEPPMVNLITYGAPSNGIFGIPNCEEGTHNYELCELVREIVSAGAYEPWLQVRETLNPGVLSAVHHTLLLQVRENTKPHGFRCKVHHTSWLQVRENTKPHGLRCKVHHSL
jgi:hypothetical protein